MNELIEKLAAIEHERWSGWMIWLFQCGGFSDGGSFVISPVFVERWQWQMRTPYENLTEAEKESDRKEVRKTLAAISQHNSDVARGIG